MQILGERTIQAEEHPEQRPGGGSSWVRGLKEVVVVGAEWAEGIVPLAEDRLREGFGGHVMWVLISHCNAF